MAFIKQEALEKAREIKVKADEEFAIEKVCDSQCSPRSLLISVSVGQTRQARAASHRCAIRKETQGRRGCAKDVCITVHVRLLLWKRAQPNERVVRSLI